MIPKQHHGYIIEMVPNNVNKPVAIVVHAPNNKPNPPHWWAQKFCSIQRRRYTLGQMSCVLFSINNVELSANNCAFSPVYGVVVLKIFEELTFAKTLLESLGKGWGYLLVTIRVLTVPTGTHTAAARLMLPKPWRTESPELAACTLAFEKNLEI